MISLLQIRMSFCSKKKRVRTSKYSNNKKKKKIKRRENAPSMGTSHIRDNEGTSPQTLPKAVSHPFPQTKKYLDL